MSMASTAVSDAEPLPTQFPTHTRKVRSWPSWERGIVYNPDKQSLRIRRIKKIEKGTAHPDSTGMMPLTLNLDPDTEYMICPLPTHPNFVNVFLNSNDPKDCEVTATDGENDGHIFIGRLNLERLGIRDQFSRFCGQLKTLYIVKTSVPESSRKG
jgi:hypothetical protein